MAGNTPFHTWCFQSLFRWVWCFVCPYCTMAGNRNGLLSLYKDIESCGEYRDIQVMWDMIQSCPSHNVHENTSSSFRLDFSSTWRSFCFQSTWKQKLLSSSTQHHRMFIYIIIIRKRITFGMWKFSFNYSRSQSLSLIDVFPLFPFIRWWEQLWIDTCFSSFINICSNLADVVHDLQEKVWFCLVLLISWRWQLSGFWSVSCCVDGLIFLKKNGPCFWAIHLQIPHWTRM